MKTILVVDDEPKIATLARDYLEHAGFAVLTAGDGPTALTTIRQRRPDLVVLDLGLPGLDGLDVTRELRRDSTIPIVMLTARDDELDKLLGLELGADDYLTKPFSPRELVARVRAVLRRADRPADAAETIHAGDVVLDLPRMRTEVAGTAVDLTPTEFELLATLAARPGRIFTRAQLLDALHGVAFESYERAIDSHIKNLRRKLEPDPRRPRYVLTVYGVGLPVRRRPGDRLMAGDGGRRPDWQRGDWSRGGGPWGPGRRGRGPWRGFGCLFGLLFLVVAGSLVAASAFVLSQLGPVPGLIAVVARRRRPGRDRANVPGAPARPSTSWSRRRGAWRPATTAFGWAHRRGGSRSARQLVRGFDTMADRLETDERQRRTLLADVSHELRTPLTVVQGNLEAIIDGVYPADPAHLALILDETRVLGRLIDDLRTLALSEAGTLALHPEPTDPEILVTEVVRSFEPAAAAAAVTLTAAIDGDLPIVEIDPVRIREVLANLVANALRHTPSGGRVTVAGAVEDDGRWIRLEVRDTGPGIDPALLPHVFDRFVKGDDSRGSGLGLAIARQLVVAHGGEIAAESVVGEGTTIQVRLPLRGG